MNYNKKTRPVVLLALLLAVALLSGFTLTGAYQIEQSKGVTQEVVSVGKESREDSLAQDFKKYAEYGVSYNTEQDAVYYNGGGRYPWSVSAESSTIRIDLYSGDKLASKDGHCLIFITHPREYGNIAVYLDGKKLN